MFWHAIRLLFSPRYLCFGVMLRTERARPVLALREQALILQRRLRKRPWLVPMARLALVLSSLALGAEEQRESC